MKKIKDCLICSNSVSTDDDNGNQVLYCLEHLKYVEENETTCEDFN